MNIIFSEISEISPLSVYFWEKIIFAFFGRRIINIIYLIFIHIYKNCHVSMYFLRKIIFHFPSKKKYYVFSEKELPSFQILQKRSYFQWDYFGKTIFSEHLKKAYSHVFYFFFFGERSSFLFRLTNNIIFLGKRNIIFPEKTRNIPFQCHFFGKIIFSEHLEKEIMFFCAVYIFSF